MSDIATFYEARLDEIEAAAKAAQAADPTPWHADAHDDGSTWQRNGHGAGLVVAADDVPLWDCEGSNMLCMTAVAARHVALHDPAYVLADVAAKRALVDQYRHAVRIHAEAADTLTEDFWNQARAMLWGVLSMLVAPYAKHPDVPDLKLDWSVR